MVWQGYQTSTTTGTTTRPNAWLDIAGVNSPTQTVLSGPTCTVLDFADFCRNNAVKAHVLVAEHAFHSRHMDKMLRQYENVLCSINFKSGNGIEYISGVDGSVVSEVDVDYWKRHTREAVQFFNAIQNMENYFGPGPILFVEIGPHPVLSALVHANISSSCDIKCLPTMRRSKASTETELYSTICTLFAQGYRINFEEFHRGHCYRKVDLPHYPFQKKKMWIYKKNDLVPKARTQPDIRPWLGERVTFPGVKSHDQGIHTQYRNLVGLTSYPYVSDHKIFEFIVVPAAVFIEIALRASSHHGVTFPIVLENFQVRAGLQLETDPINLCTTVVINIDEANNIGSVKSYSKQVS